MAKTASARRLRQHTDNELLSTQKGKLMKKYVMALAMGTALVFTGSSLKEAEAGNYFVEVSGPRGAITVGSGYGYGNRARGGYSYRSQLPPYGFTRDLLNYGRISNRYQRGYYARPLPAPRRRGRDYGYYGNRSGYRY